MALMPPARLRPHPGTGAHSRGGNPKYFVNTLSPGASGFLGGCGARLIFRLFPGVFESRVSPGSSRGMRCDGTRAGSNVLLGIWVGTVLCGLAPGFAATVEASTTRAPNDFVVEKVSVVPAMTVRAMAQTRDGYLWLGGYVGLHRFDGVRLVTFNVANSPSLPSDSISALCEDREGKLWIGTDDAGIVCYRDGEFLRFGPAEGLIEKEVYSICETSDGTIWVGTLHGVYFFKDGQFAPLTPTSILATSTVVSLATGSSGKLWIGSSVGLFRLDSLGSVPVAVLTNHFIESLAVGADNVVWVNADAKVNYRIVVRNSGTEIDRWPIRYLWFQAGTGGGIWLAGVTGKLLHSVDGDLTNATEVAEFDRRQMSAIREDMDGNLWVGIESQGLYRLRPKRVTVLSFDAGIATDNLASVLEDSRGQIWLGTFGKGLFVAKPGMLSFKAHPVPQVVNITGLHETRDGSVWFGTYNKDRFRRSDSRFVAVTNGSAGCRVIYEDREGAMWIGTLRDGLERLQDGRLQRFTTQDGLSNDRITALVQDRGGDMWIGTHRGLNRISSGKLKRFTGEESLRNTTIRGLFVDRRGDLWISSLGSGLIRYSGDKLEPITSRNGLPSDLIDDVLEDNQDRMWIGTADGIACVARAALIDCAEGRTTFVNCITLGTEDGMAQARCGTGFKPSCMKSRSGLLWFCTTGGLVVVDPTVIQPRQRPPPVYIEEVIADDKLLLIRRNAVDATQSVLIPPGTSRVGFRYTGLSFGAPERLQFRYRLDGFDDEWVSARGNREGYYTRLPVGTYQFQVAAAGKGGVSNDAGAVLAVIVIPAWWQTWWFRGLVIVGITGLVYCCYEWRIHKHRLALAMQEAYSRRLIASQEAERKRVAAELHDGLGQLLQIIKGRALSGLNRRDDSSDETARQLEEISRTAAQAISEVRAISDALRPVELDQLGLSGAVEWMAAQATATSETRFACELTKIEKPLPPEMEISLYRIAQEGINNVLKHAEATEAILELKREDDVVRLSLLDDGRGFNNSARVTTPRARFGHGLAGIEERVKLMGGEFDLQSAPGRGTRLTIVCKVGNGV